MLLSTLLKAFYPIPKEADREISRLMLDSRHILPGDMFLAIKGTHLDGQQYISDAIHKGATAILVEAQTPEQTMTWQQNVPLIPLHQLQQQAGKLAACFYAYPAKTLRVIGVTGTSGKTSCTHFIADALQALHIPCGIIGTLGSGFYDALKETGLTTPDAITLQATMHQLLAQGAKALAMEVSSHSIEQGRVNGVDFEIGIFTNLTQDHLDYHGDMETYAAVKRRFLAELPVKHLVINVEDKRGWEWASQLSPHKSVVAYSTHKPSAFPATIPLVYAEHTALTLQGIKTIVHSPWGQGELSLPLIGEFNLSNGLATLAALCLYGIPFAEAVKRLATLKSVPGRMQLLGGVNQPLVVVDYAHKPDALEKVLQALRSHSEGKLICVFGCGGERDHGKRPLMAKIAEQWADKIIVTNDNPRHENPEDIAAEILQGFSHPERVSVELERSKAIENSIQWASAKDCILIAGKGAERYQQMGDEKIPFDDVRKVTEYLAK